MKKLILSLAFVATLIFALPTTTKAEAPCGYYALKCKDGSVHMCIVCEDKDFKAWEELLCGCRQD